MVLLTDYVVQIQTSEGSKWYGVEAEAFEDLRQCQGIKPIGAAIARAEALRFMYHEVKGKGVVIVSVWQRDTIAQQIQ